MIKKKTEKYYTIESHPDKEKVYQYIRDNWHDLGEHELIECIDTLKKFAEYMYCESDYSMSIFPDRGEYITITPKCSFYEDIGEYHDIQLYKYWKDNDYKIPELIAGDCLLTGCYYDNAVIDAIKTKSKGDSFNEIMQSAADNLLTYLHQAGEYLYSYDSLYELCEANEYYFDILGAIE